MRRRRDPHVAHFSLPPRGFLLPKVKHAGLRRWSQCARCLLAAAMLLCLQPACHAMLLPGRRILNRLFSHQLTLFDGTRHLSLNALLRHFESTFSVDKLSRQIRTRPKFLHHFPVLQGSNLFRMSCSSSIDISNKYTNRLINERSTYLLQHAHNPVDWYPWGEEAFKKAKADHKLIFLSSGYSACHWCHVMEKESFENESVAKILNQYYVAIKLDKEEHPDVDRIYMSYVTRISRHGGWPLTLFLTPDLEPIYGGTYMYPEDQLGQLGLKSLLIMIAKQWKAEHVVLQREAKAAMSSVQNQVLSRLNANSNDFPCEMAWKKCLEQVKSAYDPDFGGFSRAPKFPQPSFMNYLLHMYNFRTPISEESSLALDMTLHTLKKIGYGGIHDHVGSGFARYSVDRRWQVPHFEKMLYDQAQLASVFTDAFLVSGDVFFKDMADDILLYVSRDLSHPQGGYFGAEDADSLETFASTTKKEGAFYAWKMEELQGLLMDEVDRSMFCYHFGVKLHGNVASEIDPRKELAGKNILCCCGSYEDTAKVFERPVEEVQKIIKECLETLREARDKERPRPTKDTKIVTAWNGLMIGAFAKAGFALNNDEYIERAIEAAKFVKENLMSSDGTLYRCCYGDSDIASQTNSPIDGCLEDYAYLVRGLIELYQATLDGSWLEWAESLQDIQNLHFWDKEYSSYFQSTSDDSHAVIRFKEEQDGAEPCGNSVAAHNLIRLDHYLDRPDLRDKAAGIFKGYAIHIHEIPIALPEMMAAFMLYFHSPRLVYIAGERDATDTNALIDVLRGEFLPRHVRVLADGPEGKSALLYARHKTLNNAHPTSGKATAFVCKEHVCTMPVVTPQDFRQSLTDTQTKAKTGSEGSSSESG